jgi:hypothetical protein
MRLARHSGVGRWHRARLRCLSMTEVIFERIVPVFTVPDVDAALARYRRLGFATELDEPAGYGFAERGAVSCTSNQTTRTTLEGRGASCRSVSPTPRLCTPSRQQM